MLTLVSLETASTCRGPMREKLHFCIRPSRVVSEMSACECQNSTAPLLSSSASVHALPVLQRQFSSSRNDNSDPICLHERHVQCRDDHN